MREQRDLQGTTDTSAAAFVSGSGTVCKEDSTFDGYTLGKVVTALQEQGILEAA